MKQNYAACGKTQGKEVNNYRQLKTISLRRITRIKRRFIGPQIKQMEQNNPHPGPPLKGGRMGGGREGQEYQKEGLPIVLANPP